MKKIIGLVGTRAIVLMLFLISGCAYHVAFKSPDPYQYGTTIPLKAAFHMDKTLKTKMYSSRAFGSGVANRWDVPVGEVVHQYAISYLKNGFENFQEIDKLAERPNYNILVKITDINYYMAAQAAHCDLTFVLENSLGKQVFNKKYHADGPSGMGRVFVGGVFAQKSAIRQSTHVVMETIFKSLVADISTNYKNW
ncbi:MAG: hypothetical protein ACFFCW_37650 [Candidatus Hodarchaeota archaeon]